MAAQQRRAKSKRRRQQPAQADSDTSLASRPVFPPAIRDPLGEYSLVDEKEDSPFQLLLWQRARDVRLWAVTRPDRRQQLFRGETPAWQGAMEGEAAEREELAAAIRVLAALVRFPEVMHATDVGVACLSVSGWAEENHLSATALEFAEAAALADQASAQSAAAAGQRCAKEAADARAEVWYERGRKIGRRTEDWEWYIRSYIRLCILRYEQGNFRDATRCALRARNQAVWSGMLAFSGKAHHDLLLISIALGSFSNADRHTRCALAYYPQGYERLPYFAHDYAILLTTFRFDAEALTILDAVMRVVTEPAERLVVLGTVAKAAAGAGDLPRYRAAVDDVLVLGRLYEHNAAGALALASEGAVTAGEWERAAEMAVAARELATRRHEREPERRAALVLECVAARSPLPHPSARDQGCVAETTALLLAHLEDLGEGHRRTDAGALSRGRAELTKFSIVGR
jgi:hypothetical protein